MRGKNANIFLGESTWVLKDEVISSAYKTQGDFRAHFGFKRKNLMGSEIQYIMELYFEIHQ